MINGIGLKLFPLPLTGQVGRRGVTPTGCAGEQPTAAGYAEIPDAQSLPGQAPGIKGQQGACGSGIGAPTMRRRLTGALLWPSYHCAVVTL
jgi:hypothetical protein